MEHIHSIDVSWMTHGNGKDKATTRQRSLSQPGSRDAPSSPASAPSPITIPAANRNDSPVPSPTASPTTPRQIPARPGFTRSNSGSEKTATSPGASPGRRGSWFSNISSKFSSSNAAAQSPPQTNSTPAKQGEISAPKANPAKNAVLQHAAKYEGDGPYIPAPPRSGQAGILHVFRRLSSSNGSLAPALKSSSHGLVERRVLNVDRHRERCPISELKQAKLRRVAFCVDVEVAPMPKYAEGGKAANGVCAAGDKTQKRKITEKGEGEALKNPRAVEEQKEHDGEIKATGEEVPKEPKFEGSDNGPAAVPIDAKEMTAEAQPEKAADTKKKEKKKKSEEERKARKEKKRKLAEANGTIPMEIYYDSDSSSGSTHTADGPRSPQVMPTTNPVRIYRRCCQLRETPILKKLTEQLSDPANCSSSEPGVVEKLDLTGYWMQLADLVTLGDYLAVVPIKEVILENCGLTDEGLRVILAGLLAARKPESKRRKQLTAPDGLAPQGGVVERLVLKNNKIGPEGWKHLCLFVYLCRSLKFLDISNIPFPNSAKRENGNGQPAQPNHRIHKFDVSHLLAQSIGDRLGGSTLSLLNLGETGMDAHQLGVVIDGFIKCGVRRAGLAHNNIDAEGVKHIARYLSSGKCDGLDLGGNDLRDHLEVLVDSIDENCPLWALSLAECNLKPASLCKLLPKLSKLAAFRFIDLSHNHELFSSNPSAISVLRRYLPKMRSLKRIHFADCAMSSEQAIALAEIIPEIPGLAHISFMENPEIVRLTDATTEEGQEEACALFASLLAATRVSKSLVCVDIEVPTEKSSDLVKALAKQVVAYCLTNLERLPVSELTAAAVAQSEIGVAKAIPEYPDVMQHLLGHDVRNPEDPDSDVDTAPDDDYVIGGTGVVKALACCLNNRGDESRRQSGEFIRDVESGIATPARHDMPAGKAKDMSKHLLLSARKIRLRLQPAITKARAASDDTHAYHRLLFLDNTLKGIIKRFEDEFPDTREPSLTLQPTTSHDSCQPPNTLPASPTDLFPPTAGSDIEDEPEPFSIKPPLSRSSSAVSITSRALSAEEGRVLRAGHRFRAGIFKPEHYLLASGIEDVGNDPNHVRILHEMLDELDDEGLRKKAEEIGVVRVFQEERATVLEKLKESDPEHWERFAESQLMASKNRMNGEQDGKVVGEGKGEGDAERGVDEAVVVD
ncbi:RNI-like protein [Coniochaeta ligniaria NRRL 30616]|uniref:RNI-like protein n=1 Tax=Coniochaeta ligniaria NRRL 30616 TaxID=1408157 RepID=A0A1J7J348_9PEZI|nr:RNI-like protein [Coniochaeta ligniaria NRRL 30616]